MRNGARSHGKFQTRPAKIVVRTVEDAKRVMVVYHVPSDSTVVLLPERSEDPNLFDSLASCVAGVTIKQKSGKMPSHSRRQVIGA